MCQSRAYAGLSVLVFKFNFEFQFYFPRKMISLNNNCNSLEVYIDTPPNTRHRDRERKSDREKSENRFLDSYSGHILMHISDLSTRSNRNRASASTHRRVFLERKKENEKFCFVVFFVCYLAHFRLTSFARKFLRNSLTLSALGIPIPHSRRTFSRNVSKQGKIANETHE